LTAENFNQILAAAEKLPVPDLVHEVVLRSQAQAVYAPENTGHFGLNLTRYSHFTSPIRRYADLLIHRALIRALKLGDDGLTDEEIKHLPEVAELISNAERRAMAAERETADRLLSAYLSERIGAEFDARVSGVTRSGLFVRLLETGADGFVPISSLGDDYYQHIENAHALAGQRTGLTYRLGDKVRVKLLEAIPAAGALRFEMLTSGKKAPIRGANSRGPASRPRRRRRK
jgi:ribonuclease R